MRKPERTVTQNAAILRTAKVAVVRCPSYEAGALSGAVRRSLELLGGASAFLAPGAKLFVKINHLSPHAPPERAVCTHPAFLREVLRVVLEWDVHVTVGDDVNFGRRDEFLATGFRQVCAELGVTLVNLRESGFAEIPVAGALLDSVYVARPVLEADLVLNLPKLKTHSFTIFTGAVKNLYGVIPYGLRLDGHPPVPAPVAFVPLCLCIRRAHSDPGGHPRQMHRLSGMPHSLPDPDDPPGSQHALDRRSRLHPLPMLS